MIKLTEVITYNLKFNTQIMNTNRIFLNYVHHFQNQDSLEFAEVSVLAYYVVAAAAAVVVAVEIGVAIVVLQPNEPGVSELYKITMIKITIR